MVTATMIDGLELGSLLYWSDEMSRRLPPALWLPADADDEPEMVAALGASWASYQWTGMGMWFAPGAAPKPPAGFADRYGDLQRDLVAEGSLTTPRGLTVRAEWSTLNPHSIALHDFLTAIRQARGSGSCLSIMTADASPQTWYAASTALMHRALLTFGGMNDEDRNEADRSATLTYLAAGPGAGFASLIPLNLHPWGGFAVVGDETFLSSLREDLPELLPGLAETSPHAVTQRAGGLAL